MVFLDDLVERMRVITDKTKITDIFQRAKVNGVSMYSQERTLKDLITFSIEFKNKERQLRNIKLVKRLCPHLFTGYNNLLFINLKLKETIEA